MLDSIEAVIGFASTMTYNGVRAAVRLAEKSYEKGVTVSRTLMAEANKHVQRAAGIPKYLVTISPPLRSV